MGRMGVKKGKKPKKKECLVPGRGSWVKVLEEIEEQRSVVKEESSCGKCQVLLAEEEAPWG